MFRQTTVLVQISTLLRHCLRQTKRFYDVARSLNFLNPIVAMSRKPTVAFGVQRDIPGCLNCPLPVPSVPTGLNDQPACLSPHLECWRGLPTPLHRSRDRTTRVWPVVARSGLYVGFNSLPELVSMLHRKNRDARPLIPVATGLLLQAPRATLILTPSTAEPDVRAQCFSPVPPVLWLAFTSSFVAPTGCARVTASSRPVLGSRDRSIRERPRS